MYYLFYALLVLISSYYVKDFASMLIRQYQLTVILSYTRFGFMRALSHSAWGRNDGVKASCSYYPLQFVQTILFFFHDVLELFLWKHALLALSFVGDCLRQCFPGDPRSQPRGPRAGSRTTADPQAGLSYLCLLPNAWWVRLLQGPSAPSNALLSMGRCQNFVVGGGGQI